jgi:hypothetical protein
VDLSDISLLDRDRFERGAPHEGFTHLLERRRSGVCQLKSEMAGAGRLCRE